MYLLEQSFEGQSFLILTSRSRVWPVNHLNHHGLDKLIHGSERALGEKDEGILIDGQKKRKSAKKDGQSQKAEKIDVIQCMCANIPRCCSVSAITREKTIKL